MNVFAKNFSVLLVTLSSLAIAAHADTAEDGDIAAQCTSLMVSLASGNSADIVQARTAKAREFLEGYVQSIKGKNLAQLERENVNNALESLRNTSLPHNAALSGVKINDIVKRLELSDGTVKTKLTDLDKTMKSIREGIVPTTIMGRVKSLTRWGKDKVMAPDIETQLDRVVEETATAAENLNGQIEDMRSFIAEKLSEIEVVEDDIQVSRIVVKNLEIGVASLNPSSPQYKFTMERTIPDILSEIEVKQALIKSRLESAQVFQQIAMDFSRVVKKTTLVIQTKPEQLRTALIQIRLNRGNHDLLDIATKLSEATEAAKFEASKSVLDLKERLKALEVRGFDDPNMSKKIAENIRKAQQMELQDGSKRLSLLMGRVNANEEENQKLLASVSQDVPVDLLALTSGSSEPKNEK